MPADRLKLKGKAALVSNRLLFWVRKANARTIKIPFTSDFLSLGRFLEITGLEHGTLGKYNHGLN